MSQLSEAPSTLAEALDSGFAEPAAKRWKGKARSSGDPSEEGEVRYRDPEAAARAVRELNGSVVSGNAIKVMLDPNAQDGTKVVISNMPAGMAWQDLKDHFVQLGHVHYANIGRTVQEVGSVRGFGAALPGYPCVGEVRFANSDEAQMALQMFNGMPFKDQALVVKPDLSSWHGTKLLIFNIPVGTDWPELKDHFEPAGQIQFCGIDCALGKGKGKKAGFPDQGGQPFFGGGPACGNMCAQGQGFMQEGPGNFPNVGEIRFEASTDVEQAISMLHGSTFDGSVLKVVKDLGCQDGTRVLVFGVPQGTPRHLLKEHFEKAGSVAFCGWKGKGRKGGNKDQFGKDGKGGCQFGPDPGFHQGFGKDQYGQNWKGGGCQFGPDPGFQCQGFGKDQYGYGKNWKGGCQGGCQFGPGPCFQQGFGKDQFGYGKNWKGGCQFGPDPGFQAMPTAGGCCGPSSAQPGSGGSYPIVGEVRYRDPAQATQAISMFHGSQLGNSVISVVKDGGCWDGSRVLVFGLPSDIQRNNLQEYFEQIGQVAFCGWKGKGKGRGPQDGVSSAGGPPPQGCGAVMPPPVPEGAGGYAASNPGQGYGAVMPPPGDGGYAANNPGQGYGVVMPPPGVGGYAGGNHAQDCGAVSPPPAPCGGGFVSSNPAQGCGAWEQGCGAVMPPPPAVQGFAASNPVQVSLPPQSAAETWGCGTGVAAPCGVPAVVQPGGASSIYSCMAAPPVAQQVASPGDQNFGGAAFDPMQPCAAPGVASPCAAAPTFAQQCAAPGMAHLCAPPAAVHPCGAPQLAPM